MQLLRLIFIMFTFSAQRSVQADFSVSLKSVENGTSKGGLYPIVG